MPGIFKIKNLQDAEFTLTHPDGVGAVSIDSNNIAKSDVVNAALELKANTADLKEIGVGQTWQDVIASRVLGTTYTNSTGKPIMVSYTSYSGGLIFINSVEIAKSSTGAVSTSYTFIVPNGATYKISDGAMGTHWKELR